MIKRYIFSYNLFYSQIWLDLPNHHRHNLSTSFLSMDARQLLQAQHSVCVCVCECVCVFFKQHNTINCLWREKQNFLKKNTNAAAATTRAEYCQRLKI
jgi:hypothetical protein